jgi:hypothetical protein
MLKICVNGEIRDATPEEIAEMERLAEQTPKPEPTPEERLVALEEQLRAAKILLGVE